MANKTQANPAVKKYVKTGVIAVIVIAVAALGIWGISALRGGATSGATVEEALTVVTPDATTGDQLRVAVIRMDAIQTQADALVDLTKQRQKYEDTLRKELEDRQKELEAEKKEIEESQDVLSRDALQRRVVDYQNRVNELQRDLTERAQSIEVAFQQALNDIQTQHLDPVIEGVIAKKNLSLVIDGRFARVGANAENLDITDEVINALNKKISSVKMQKPQGF